VLNLSGNGGFFQARSEEAPQSEKSTGTTQLSEHPATAVRPGRRAKPKGPPRVSYRIQSQRARRIIGMTVEDHDGQKLGRVRDLVVDLSSGQVKCAIISSGGFLGLASKARAVPGPALSMATAKRDTLAFELSKPEWEKASGFKRSRGGNLQLATGLMGKKVINQEKENVGEVLDLVVDFTGQKPVFAILSAGKLLKTVQSFAVPLRSLSLAAGKKLMIDANRTRFEEAREFDEDQWQAASSTGAGRVYRFAIEDE